MCVESICYSNELKLTYFRVSYAQILVFGIRGWCKSDR